MKRNGLNINLPEISAEKVIILEVGRGVFIGLMEAKKVRQ